MQKVDLNISSLAGYDKDAFCRYFGLYVIERRMALSLSQLELAQSVGVKLRDIQLIENGKKFLDQETFEKICLKLNLNLDDVDNMGRITHAQYLMDFFRMMDENYPR